MFSLIFSALCAWFAFFLPCFATFKLLSQHPIPEAELQTTAKYWTVIGAFVGFEYLAGWFISWLPFYWEAKTVFLLFLSLPQTQGSTFVYDTYLKPFFVKNHNSIDSGIISIQGSIISFIHTRLYAVWELLWSVINKTPPAGQPPAAAPPPTAGFSVESAMGLWRTYGPSLLSAIQTGSARAAPATPPVTPSASASSTSTDNLPGASAEQRIPTPISAAA
ncbi:TB2/DP1, HVA22 family-domain-containing protein [Desarmillaria tabescens]|uniref:Protein YOP1 n=1 Tax=Armillaria tabescens TaxID=1929756 RepID=A0AA39T4Y4_ARMTA|nr:TB2/DP1, HVA22 family-domain-containing protein [Desarmillaria tabescens]KAK0464996.1 TB2/DP1, HVA22 family-domain-containing protein [Desarmillaria tabescens]